MKSVQVFFAAVLLLLSQWVYAGEFDDHCVTALAGGMLIKTKCEINIIFDGKMYCFASQESKQKFSENPKEMVIKAVEFYAKHVEPDREKISQADVINQIKSKTCDLSNKDAGYLELDGMDLRHCNMNNASFFGAYLRGANLSGANLERAYLNLARLENANLSYANLKDAIIFQAIFDKTNFKGANLSNARVIGTLGNVDMSEANIVKGRFGLDIGNQPMGAMRFDAVGGNFSNSNFEGADINRNNVRFANFRNANLRNANLFRADFSKADLTGADISGADMNEAILDGTIMTGVKGIEAIAGYDRSKGECVDCKVLR
jgi:uncharacterized protein YjbI with pentapeptide repeats